MCIRDSSPSARRRGRGELRAGLDRGVGIVEDGGLVAVLGFRAVLAVVVVLVRDVAFGGPRGGLELGGVEVPGGLTAGRADSGGRFAVRLDLGHVLRFVGHRWRSISMEDGPCGPPGQCTRTLTPRERRGPGGPRDQRRPSPHRRFRSRALSLIHISEPTRPY